MDYKARFYSPYLNHFIQPDSLIPDPSNPQAHNRFGYVHNNPINFTDPSGHCTLGGHWMPDNSSACGWSSNNQGSLSGQGNGGFVNSGGNGNRDVDPAYGDVLIGPPAPVILGPVVPDGYYELTTSNPLENLDLTDTCRTFTGDFPLFCEMGNAYHYYHSSFNSSINSITLPHPSNMISMSFDVANSWLDLKIPGIFGMGLDYTTQKKLDEGKGYSWIEGNARALAVTVEGQGISYISAGASGLSVIGTVETGPGVIAVAIGVYIGSNMALSSFADTINNMYIFPAIQDFTN